ncbi:MAG: hypothetical protein OIN84_10890 [Candidatus Methanoperedens sp.]|uniref:hypothetical protein n=1 Tax=Candidatus Methanoperedens sp. BLZ2 TaxID=2035255 RepID=UPI001596706E|nr:hypothetical protein [Candidatus Methanoperedens sp. BLZ2]MBZ0174450.1 hypothetical protein [Candidatus Methanoperedens nitroreducens]MCX9078469.1 hypothetical protein [Candidatus Methanoperedens sp.]
MVRTTDLRLKRRRLQIIGYERRINERKEEFVMEVVNTIQLSIWKEQIRNNLAPIGC